VFYFFLLFGLFTTVLEAKIPEKVVLCGVCRDVAKKLPQTRQIMEHIGELFEDYRVVVYENNSTDGTKRFLKKWQKQNSKVHVVCENYPLNVLANLTVNRYDDQRIFRPEAIALARNKVLDIVMADPYAEFSFVLWMDMDFTRPPAYEGIVEVFQSEREWDAVLAYGVDPNKKFWDWYAFRDRTYPIGSELLGNTWWYMKKKFQLGAKAEWYSVTSAFGGFGIYRKSAIEGCRYSALVTEDLETVAKEFIAQNPKHPQVVTYWAQVNELKQLVTLPPPSLDLPKTDPAHGVILHPHLPNSLIWRMSSFVYQYPSVCEHVPFHASMIVRGHRKLFINPRMIFNYGD
jgi:hypothetical protein